jgi:hypothetical protein
MSLWTRQGFADHEEALERGLMILALRKAKF